MSVVINEKVMMNQGIAALILRLILGLENTCVREHDVLHIFSWQDKRTSPGYFIINLEANSFSVHFTIPRSHSLVSWVLQLTFLVLRSRKDNLFGLRCIIHVVALSG